MYSIGAIIGADLQCGASGDRDPLIQEAHQSSAQIELERLVLLAYCESNSVEKSGSGCCRGSELWAMNPIRWQQYRRRDQVYNQVANRHVRSFSDCRCRRLRDPDVGCGVEAPMLLRNYTGDGVWK